VGVPGPVVHQDPAAGQPCAAGLFIYYQA